MSSFEFTNPRDFTKVLSGPNYLQWSEKMKAHFQATSRWFVIPKTRPEEPPAVITLAGDGANHAQVSVSQRVHDAAADKLEKWDSANEQVTGALMLMIAESITPQLKDFTTAKDIWDYLERSYGRPRVSAVYTDFKKLLQMSIPDNKDPTVALDEYVAHCNRLAANNVTFDEHIKAMILMAQLPQSMEAAVLLAINGKEVKQLSIADARHTSHGQKKVLVDGLLLEIGVHRGVGPTIVMSLRSKCYSIWLDLSLQRFPSLDKEALGGRQAYVA